VDTAIDGFHHVKLPVADLALRHDPARAVALVGFDPIALRVSTRAAMDAWQQRLADLGEPHGGIITGHAGGVLVGLHDPDGIEVRLYLPAEAAPGGANEL
jgi:hypothetical protein